MSANRTIRVGGPCTCEPGRYIRFAMPKVPGLVSSIISCQDNEGTHRHTIHEHPIPEGADVEVFCPTIAPQTVPAN